MRQASLSVAAPPSPARRWYLPAVLTLLLAAGLWRAVIAAALPCLARDSVTFCEYARDLGQEGWAYLRRPTTHQHPLFPLLVLGAQRTARALGAPDTPWTWQRSGQVVAWLAGTAVVLLAGALCRRLVQRLALPIDADLATCGGLLLAGLLPQNVWLSGEVMSDELHLAFYLAGVWVLLGFDSLRSAVACGLLAGAAFLTRPEGMTVALAGVLTAAVTRSVPRRTRGLRALAVASAFVVVAAPYWAVTGKLSAKKDPLEWLRDREAARPPAFVPGRNAGTPGPVLGHDLDPRFVQRWAGPQRCGTLGAVRRTTPAGSFLPLLAKLERLDLPWYALLPWVLYTVFRAGRVVVPLLALAPLVNLRRRLLAPPLVGLTTCAAIHLALLTVLLHRHGYVAQRHALVVVMLLVPFAAALLARVLTLGRTGQWPRPVSAAVLLAVLLPLAAYSARLPNAKDRYLVEAARWLQQRDPQLAEKRIMSGNSPRRVVFYAGADWVPWYESPQYVDALCRRLRAERPDYFLLETGPGFEREGNAALLEKLLPDARLQPHLAWVEARPIPAGGTLHVLAFRWAEN